MDMPITLNTTSLFNGQGFDVQSMVNQVLESQRGQETLWKSQQTTLQSQATALNQIESQIAALYTDANSLRDFGGVMGSKTASSSQPGIVIATATSATATAN
jgi:flagellar capping protein FliD